MQPEFPHLVDPESPVTVDQAFVVVDGQTLGMETLITPMSRANCPPRVALRRHPFDAHFGGSSADYMKRTNQYGCFSDGLAIFACSIFGCVYYIESCLQSASSSA